MFALLNVHRNLHCISEPVVDFQVILISSYQVGLWVFGGTLKVDAVTAAILGLSILLTTGVVTWKECLAESVAWDTLTWFAALIAMAGYLNKYGLISWFSETVVKV
jgi:di/tricarboxylate transporter